MLRAAQHLPIIADALEPVVQAEQVGEAHAAMHLGCCARDEGADLRQMRLGVCGEAAGLVRQLCLALLWLYRAGDHSGGADPDAGAP